LKQLSLIAAGIMLSLSLTAQNDWQLKKDEDGIKVYTKATENSHYNELKVEMTLTATLSSLAALILDIDNYHNWSFNTEKTYVLKRVGPGDLYFYESIHSPWPASDRDLPVHLQITQDPHTRSMFVRSVCIPDLIPPKKDIVRVPLSVEQYIVTPLPDGKIRIEYQLKLDPGAGAPAWLINLFSVKGPFETFSHVRQQIQRPAYRDAILPFIKN
jgi:START domain